MSKIFESIGVKSPRYSAFDLSHEKKLSCDMGKLVPIYLEEIVPGDSFKVKSELMMRLAPMIAPVMHRVNVYVHYFFVPNRIIWNQWEDFITAGRLGTTKPSMPQFSFFNAAGSTTGTIEKGTVADYFGLPVGIPLDNKDILINALPFRAYQQIFNDYFKDPNMTSDTDVSTMTSAQLNLIRARAWEKDYFTSCLPFAQRGPQVNVPAEVQYKDVSEVVRTSDGANVTGPLGSTSVLGNLLADYGGGSFAARLENLEEDPINVSINDLRTSSALQRFLEKTARGGHRYIEQILTHFGVKSSDSRLQRPEYLGGGRQPVVISEVLNNTGTEDAPQGTMAGHGISVGTTNSFKRKFEEHGWVMGIMSVLPRTAYQQGVHRMWQRASREDYYWPDFANLGEQAVSRLEIYWDPTQTETQQLEETFGYQQRYAEYKYGMSTVHGDFRDTLDFWHMGRKFTTAPVLNDAFMRANPTDRIFAVQDGTNTLWVQVYNDVKARRPMPYFADPRLA